MATVSWHSLPAMFFEQAERFREKPFLWAKQDGLYRPITWGETASRYVQLVLTDRSSLTQGREFGVFGDKTWRLADMGAKHAFLKAGLGWGGMPRHLVQEDLQSGALVSLDLQAFEATEMVVRMAAAWRIDSPPGLAGRWMIDRLRRGGADEAPPL